MVPALPILPCFSPLTNEWPEGSFKNSNQINPISLLKPFVSLPTFPTWHWAAVAPWSFMFGHASLIFFISWVGITTAPTHGVGRSKGFNTHKVPRPESDHNRCSINGTAIRSLLLWICQGLPCFKAFTKASVTHLFLFVWLILFYLTSSSLLLTLRDPLWAVYSDWFPSL